MSAIVLLFKSRLRFYCGVKVKVTWLAVKDDEPRQMHPQRRGLTSCCCGIPGIQKAVPETLTFPQPCYTTFHLSVNILDNSGMLSAAYCCQ